MTRAEERKLIDRAKRGNPEAFRQMVEAYKDRLYAFIWKMVRNHHEAEDVCQAAFVKAYQSLASYSDAYAFSTWLFTIGYRICLNQLRKKRALSGDMDFSHIGGPEESDAAISVANSEEARRLRDEVWAAVDTLTPPQKTAVLLFYKENKSCQEIGLVLGIPAVTVKSHLHRARAKLKSVLDQGLVSSFLDLGDLRDSRTA